MGSTLCVVGLGVGATAYAAFCCECSICEKPDTWKIEDETREGERGAGFLYKRGKGAAVWSKRYFVITDHKMVYYVDRDRTIMKGEIILAGAIARESTTRASSKKKHYFTISHPKCGTREFYAKTVNRRNQWMALVNDMSSMLSRVVYYSKLLKQGGLGKNTWQERWCICNGRSLDYFEKASDNQSKGSIDLLGAKIAKLKVKDKPFCFEVSCMIPGKKGHKKYVFATEKEIDYQGWLTAIDKAVTGNPFPSLDEETTANPILNQEEGDSSKSNPNKSESKDEEEEKSEVNIRTTTKPASSAPPSMSGPLQKKSPNVMKGWQKRFTKIQYPGEIVYYSTESALIENPNAPKGVVQLSEILPLPRGLSYTEGSTEFTLNRASSKSLQMKAKSVEEAKEWVQSLKAWIDFASD